MDLIWWGKLHCRFKSDRIFMDLDMFSTEPSDTNDLKSKLEDDFPFFQVILESQNTLITTIIHIKVDFIRFKYGFAYPIKNEG